MDLFSTNKSRIDYIDGTNIIKGKHNKKPGKLRQPGSYILYFIFCILYFVLFIFYLYFTPQP